MQPKKHLIVATLAFAQVFTMKLHSLIKAPRQVIRRLRPGIRSQCLVCQDAIAREDEPIRRFPARGPAYIEEFA